MKKIKLMKFLLSFFVIASAILSFFPCAYETFGGGSAFNELESLPSRTGEVLDDYKWIIAALAIVEVFLIVRWNPVTLKISKYLVLIGGLTVLVWPTLQSALRPTFIGGGSYFFEWSVVGIVSLALIFITFIALVIINKKQNKV